MKYLRKRITNIINLNKLLLVGQFNNEFIILSKCCELYVIDQHGLHERVLYEYFKQNFTDKIAKSKACRNAIKFGDKLKVKFIYF